MKQIAIAAAIVFAVASDAAAKNLYIPAAGSAPGANNTRFRTDVRIFNPSSTTPISVSVHFLPQGMDGSNISGRIVQVGPRQMAVLNDIVANFLQWPVPAVGAIRLDSDTDKSYEFSAESRTYTDSPNPAAPGTFGQFIPALDPGVSGLKLAVVPHLIHNDAFRTNAGVMNPNREPITVNATLVRADGTLAAETATFVVPPMSMTLRPLAQLFGAGTVLEDGYVAINTSLPAFPFASVVDNQSGDAIFIPGVQDLVE
ncbi:MAG TPA: hypothetical protein VF432_21265 [Thermoanaerobaculia bacterium]